MSDKPFLASKQHNAPPGQTQRSALVPAMFASAKIRVEPYSASSPFRTQSSSSCAVPPLRPIALTRELSRLKNTDPRKPDPPSQLQH